MKRWENYKGLLLKGDWHIHSNYTDGTDSIHDCVSYAKNNSLKAICFTEHVRKELSYDYLKFKKEAKKYNSDSLIVLAGAEAKVLNSAGELDISDDIIKEAELILSAFHGFDTKKENYFVALTNMIKNKNVDVWAHPFSQPFEKLNSEEVYSVVDNLAKNNVLVELNIRRFSLPKLFIDLCLENKVNFIIGSDAHSTKEIWSGKDLPQEILAIVNKYGYKK